MLVSLDLALKHLGLDPATDDETLQEQVTGTLEGAIATLEAYLGGRQLAAASYTEAARGDGTEDLWLKNSPVTAITAITMATMTLGLARSFYDLCGASAPELADVSISTKGRLTRTDGKVWANGGLYTFSYTAGYADDGLPADLRMAVLMITDHIWNRTGKVGIARHVSGRSEVWFDTTDLEKMPVLAGILRRHKSVALAS